MLAFSTEKLHQITSKVKKDTITFRRRLGAWILKEAFYRASNNHVFLMSNARLTRGPRRLNSRALLTARSAGRRVQPEVGQLFAPKSHLSTLVSNLPESVNRNSSSEIRPCHVWVLTTNPCSWTRAFVPFHQSSG